MKKIVDFVKKVIWKQPEIRINTRNIEVEGLIHNTLQEIATHNQLNENHFLKYQQESNKKRLFELLVSETDYQVKMMLAKDIQDSYIDTILDGLKKYKDITEIYLHNYFINLENVQKLSEALSENVNIKLLEFSNNNLTPEVFKHLIDFLTKNKALTTLSIKNNYIDEKTIGYLISALNNNHTLVKLDLHNTSNPGVIQQIADFLRTNKSLINLNMNLDSELYEEIKAELNNKCLLFYNNKKLEPNYSITKNLAEKLYRRQDLTSKEYAEFLDREDGQALKYLIKEEIKKSNEIIEDIEALYNNAKNKFKDNAFARLAIAKELNGSNFEALPLELRNNIVGYAFKTGNDLREPFIVEKRLLDEKMYKLLELVKDNNILEVKKILSGLNQHECKAYESHLQSALDIANDNQQISHQTKLELKNALSKASSTKDCNVM